MTGKKRIFDDFDAFCNRVEIYKKSIGSKEQKDCCESAYEGLYKFFERIKKEIGSKELDKELLSKCHKILADEYLAGILKLRKVATHIQSSEGKKEGVIRFFKPAGNSVEIPGDSSPSGVFTADIIPDVGKHCFERISHLENLQTAVKRIEKELSNVK